MKKFLLTFFSAVLLIGIIFVISCQKTPAGPTGPTGNPKFKSMEVQDKYIVVNFEESGFSGSKVEFRAVGKITADTANKGKDLKVQITSPTQKIPVMPGSGYDITIVDLTSGEKILHQKNDVTTYLFYEDFNTREALPANANQAKNTEPWKNKWVAAWQGKSAWNHAMNGSFRNLELKKDPDGTEYLHMRGTKTGDDDSTSAGSGMQTAHLYGKNESPVGEGMNRREPFFFTYGKVEFRARMESQVGKQKPGPFPALWLMPARGDDANNPKWRDWAAGGEIDVMEYVKGTPGQVDQTIHVGYYGNGNTDPEYQYSSDGGNQKISDIDQWHTYTLEWTKEGLSWYIDGVKGRNDYKYQNNMVKYPFVDKSAFYIIINVGVGRQTDGYPGGAQKGLDTWMDVDSIKVMPNKDTILDNSRGPNGCEYYQDVQW